MTALAQAFQGRFVLKEIMQAQTRASILRSAGQAYRKYCYTRHATENLRLGRKKLRPHLSYFDKRKQL